jgi:hypothetical protein
MMFSNSLIFVSRLVDINLFPQTKFQMILDFRVCFDAKYTKPYRSIFNFYVFILNTCASWCIVSMSIPYLNEHVWETLCPLNWSLHHNVILFLLYFCRFVFQPLIDDVGSLLDPFKCHCDVSLIDPDPVQHGYWSVKIVHNQKLLETFLFRIVSMRNGLLTLVSLK